MGLTPNTGHTLQNAIIDLYLNVKIRTNEQVSSLMNLQIDKFDKTIYKEEYSKLSSHSPFLILEYIRSSVEILMDLKNESNDSMQNKAKKNELFERPKGYEELLRKFEEESRDHIRIEQQLKLYVDDVEENLNKSEKEIKKLKQMLKTRVEEENKLKEKLKESITKCDEMEKKLKEKEQIQGHINEDKKRSSELRRISDLSKWVFIYIKQNEGNPNRSSVKILLKAIRNEKNYIYDTDNNKKKSLKNVIVEINNRIQIK